MLHYLLLKPVVLVQNEISINPIVSIFNHPRTNLIKVSSDNSPIQDLKKLIIKRIVMFPNGDCQSLRCVILQEVPVNNLHQLVERFWTHIFIIHFLENLPCIYHHVINKVINFFVTFAYCFWAIVKHSIHVALLHDDLEGSALLWCCITR